MLNKGDDLVKEKRKGLQEKKIGGPEYRSRRLSHAKRALYHMS